MKTFKFSITSSATQNMGVSATEGESCPRRGILSLYRLLKCVEGITLLTHFLLVPIKRIMDTPRCQPKNVPPSLLLTKLQFCLSRK